MLETELRVIYTDPLTLNGVTMPLSALVEIRGADGRRVQ